MPANVYDARLDFYYPETSGGPDLQVGAEDFRNFRFRRSFRDDPGGGTIRIDNGAFGTDGTYNATVSTPVGDRPEIDIMDRCEVYVLTEHNSAGATLGDIETRRWTTLVKNLRAGVDSEGNYLELDVENFVFGILKRRTVANVFRDRNVSGASSNIVETILSNNAPEIGQARIEPEPVTLSIIFNYDNALGALDTVARRVGAVMRGLGTDLDWKYLSNLRADFGVTQQDVQLPVDNEKASEELINQWYITGGTTETQIKSFTTDNSSEQPPDAATPVYTSNNIDVNANNIPRIDVLINELGNGNSHRLRVQPGTSSGGPVAPFDRDQDLGSAKKVDSDYSSTGKQWSSFDVGIDNLATDRIALVWEGISDNPNNSFYDNIYGDDGGSGDLVKIAHKIYTGYPVVGIAGDTTSKQSYRNSEGRKRENLPSNADARKAARQRLERTTTPTQTISFRANSARTHQANPQEIFTYNYPAVRASGKFGITQVNQTYEATNLTTEITAINVESL